jgi:hypothetical protein
MTVQISGPSPWPSGSGPGAEHRHPRAAAGGDRSHFTPNEPGAQDRYMASRHDPFAQPLRICDGTQHVTRSPPNPGSLRARAPVPITSAS